MTSEKLQKSLELQSRIEFLSFKLDKLDRLNQFFSLQKNGKTKRNVRIRRSMSDWFHAPLERNIDAFADLVADYYGDKYLVNFRRLGANDVVNGGV